MTVFRVNVDRDFAKVVKKGPTRVKDKELVRALKEFGSLDDLTKALNKLESLSWYYVQKARNVYKVCDKRLKGKGLSKDDKGELLFIRKKAYDFTMSLKKKGFV